MRSQRRDLETMDIRSGVWFSDYKALTAEKRADVEQREKEIAHFNFLM